MRFLKVALGLSLGLGAWLPVLAAEEAALQTPETTTELWRYRAGDAEYRISRVERRRLGGELESAELSVVRVGPDGVDRISWRDAVLFGIRGRGGLFEVPLAEREGLLLAYGRRLAAEAGGLEAFAKSFAPSPGASFDDDTRWLYSKLYGKELE